MLNKTIQLINLPSSPQDTLCLIRLTDNSNFIIVEANERKRVIQLPFPRDRPSRLPQLPGPKRLQPPSRYLRLPTLELQTLPAEAKSPLADICKSHLRRHLAPFSFDRLMDLKHPRKLPQRIDASLIVGQSLLQTDNLHLRSDQHIGLQASLQHAILQKRSPLFRVIVNHHIVYSMLMNDSHDALSNIFICQFPL